MPSSADKIQEKINQLNEEQNWMYNFQLPGGIETRPGYVGRLTQLRTELVKKLELDGKRVLDIGCSEGWYSILAARKGANVLGIDIDEKRIDKAKYINNVLGDKNVNFEVMDLYSERFQDLKDFDIAFCMGLFHRIPDPFNLIAVLSTKVDALFCEWETQPYFADQNKFWGYHEPGGLLEWKNAVAHFEDRERADKSLEGRSRERASYWFLSYGCVEAICSRVGYNHFLRMSLTPGFPERYRDAKRICLLANKNPTQALGRKSREGLIAPNFPLKYRIIRGIRRRIRRFYSPS